MHRLTDPCHRWSLQSSEGALPAPLRRRAAKSERRRAASPARLCVCRPRPIFCCVDNTTRFFRAAKKYSISATASRFYQSSTASTQQCSSSCVARCPYAMRPQMSTVPPPPPFAMPSQTAPPFQGRHAPSHGQPVGTLSVARTHGGVPCVPPAALLYWLCSFPLVLCCLEKTSKEAHNGPSVHIGRKQGRPLGRGGGGQRAPLPASFAVVAVCVILPPRIVLRAA